ncbi:MAG: gliding motility-associated C-terminal domain-containing protein [Bacteroidales bacterium]|nr:gliding motility-associated C-terminal domain-containing protein [Bacteroidales bacterium]
MKKTLLTAVCCLPLSVPHLVAQNVVHLSVGGKVTNSVIYGNRDQNPVSSETEVEHSALDSLTTGPGNIELTATPFVANFRIDETSPAFKSGNPSAWNYEQDSLCLDFNSRLVTAGVSMGAFEYNEPIVEVDTFTIAMDFGAGCIAGEGWASATATGSTGPYTYLWSNGVSDMLNPNLQPGTYTVTVTDVGGISRTDTVTVPASIPVSITVQSVTTAGGEDCSGGSVFTTISGGVGDLTNFTFEWYNHSGLYHSAGQDLINVESGSYTLIVTDEESCESSAIISIPCSYRRVMPTLYISPNNDEFNDYLGIKYIERYPINTVIILNSAGDEVNRIANYDNEDPNRRWDGKNKRNQVLPDGIYYYVILAEDVASMAGWLLMKASKSK